MRLSLPLSHSDKASGYGDRSFAKKLNESYEAVAGDFIDIKIREDVSQLLDRKLRVHLQKLEKEKRLRQQKEDQQAKKEKALAENKTHGAEVQKKLRQKKAVQQRLHEKGLCSKPGEKSGKDVKWGDRKVSLETARGKGR